MEKKKLIMDDEMVMHEIIANQVSISEQEDAYAALEAKYNNVEEAVEQDLDVYKRQVCHLPFSDNTWHRDYNLRRPLCFCQL